MSKYVTFDDFAKELSESFDVDLETIKEHLEKHIVDLENRENRVVNRKRMRYTDRSDLHDKVNREIGIQSRLDPIFAQIQEVMDTWEKSPERDEELVRLVIKARQTKATLDEIAYATGSTRERIRQILARHGVR